LLIPTYPALVSCPAIPNWKKPGPTKSQDLLKLTDVVDLTKEVIFDEKFKTKYKDWRNRTVQKDILYLINEFKKNWVSKDDILDKILEKGMSSLTKFDLEILKS
jgi:hypothetical protein